MRRSIQDLVSSVDPNVKIDAEVEDVSVATSWILSSADRRIDGAVIAHYR